MPYEWALGALERLPEGIEPYEVMQVLGSDRPRFPVPSLPGGPRMLSIWGRTDEGRALMVICRWHGGFKHDIAFARDLSESERQMFEKWEETRDGE